MDAKVGDWVVTPRRGKAVEINALWYNALRLLAGWLEAEELTREASAIQDHAQRARTSFNQRFWCAAARLAIRRRRHRGPRRRFAAPQPTVCHFAAAPGAG